MAVKQLSVFVSNQPGSMVKITQLLRDAKVDIRALAVADTQNFGIIHFIPGDHDKAKSVLLENNCLVSDDTVVGVVMPDTPGGLTDVLTYLSEEKINIEYLYAFLIPQKGKACVVLRVSAPHEVDQLLLARGFELIDDHLE